MPAIGVFTTCDPQSCHDLAVEQLSCACGPVSPEPLTFTVANGGNPPQSSISVTFTYSITPFVPLKTLGDCDCDPGAQAAGDPINVATGNLYEQVVDYQSAGQNPLSLIRTYNSAAIPGAATSDLGANWRSNFDRFLDLNGGQVLAERPDGRIVTFTFHSGPTYTTDSDVDMTLSLSGSTWTLTDSDDTIETYTTSGTKALLQSIEARNGYTQTLAYNGNSQLISVTDSFARLLTFTYQNGVLHTATTPDGLVLTYNFASTGLSGTALDQLTGVSYSTSPGTSQSYHYTNSGAPNALTGIVDEDGNSYASFAYDSSGRAISSQHADGADLTTLTYNADGTTIATNALGEQEIYKFTTLQGVSKITEIDRQATATTAAATRLFTYDGNGYLAGRTDWNGVPTNYVNDAHGQPLTITEAAGTSAQRVTTIAYLSNFHLPSQIVGPRTTTDFTYDANGELLSRSETDDTVRNTPYSTQGQTRTWNFTWGNALLATAKTPRSEPPTQFGYDSTGALTSVIDPLGHQTRITGHSPGGYPQTVIDPNGVTTVLAYDARQRLVTSTLETVPPLITSFAYDAAGNLTGRTLPDGSALTFTYDAAHRLTVIADLADRRIQYTLDALGDRTQSQTLGGAGVVRRSGTATFDALGRVIQSVGGAGQTTGYAYDNNGNLLSVADPRGLTTQYGYDARNHTVQITEGNGAITEIAYNQLDQISTVTDAIGHRTTYVYDGFGGLIEELSPDRGATVYTYNFGGLQTQAVDAAGNTVKRVFDGDDRVTSATYPADPAENILYTYDQGTNAIGRLTGIADAAGTLALAYNVRGLLITATRTHGSVTATTRYTYDTANRLKTLSYPSDLVVTYSRDNMGRITAVAAQQGAGASATVVSSIVYQPFGPTAGLVYGDGSTETRTLDLDYRLTALASAVQNLAYTYDADDNVTVIADGIVPVDTQSFGYNRVNRLISASGDYGTLAYTYDQVGNRLTGNATVDGNVTTQAYAYLAGDNRLATVAQGGAFAHQFAYAANGTPTSDARSVTTLDFTYNQANRLASVQQGSSTIAQYTYDAFGRRTVKTVLAATTLYTYDAAGRVIEEDDISSGSPVPVADYIYLEDRPVGLYLPASGLHFYHGDRLGTPQLVTDRSQNTVWRGVYQPFGAVAVTAAVTQNLRLPGQYADAETGLFYNGMRSYAPDLGRYIEPDRIGLKGGVDPYAYTAGNPVNRTDRLGLEDGKEQPEDPAVKYATEACQGILQQAVKYSLEIGGARKFVEAVDPPLLAFDLISEAGYINESFRYPVRQDTQSGFDRIDKALGLQVPNQADPAACACQEPPPTQAQPFNPPTPENPGSIGPFANPDTQSNNPGGFLNSPFQ